jgi:hypothetical protein
MKADRRRQAANVMEVARRSALRYSLITEARRSERRPGLMVARAPAAVRRREETHECTSPGCGARRPCRDVPAELTDEVPRPLLFLQRRSSSAYPSDGLCLSARPLPLPRCAAPELRLHARASSHFLSHTCRPHRKDWTRPRPRHHHCIFPFSHPILPRRSSHLSNRPGKPSSRLARSNIVQPALRMHPTCLRQHSVLEALL